MRRNRSSHRSPATPAGPDEIAIDPKFVEDLIHWVETDPRLALRLLGLVQAIYRNPFQGIGKPEPLKHGSGIWSRRLTEEHRITYFVRSAGVYFIRGRGHYPG